jgi:hypothetical protein
MVPSLKGITPEAYAIPNFGKETTKAAVTPPQSSFSNQTDRGAYAVYNSQWSPPLSNHKEFSIECRFNGAKNV